MYETILSTNMQWHIGAIIISMSTLAFITGLEPLTVAASLLLITCNYYVYIYTHLNYIDSDNNGDNQYLSLCPVIVQWHHIFTTTMHWLSYHAIILIIIAFTLGNSVFLCSLFLMWIHWKKRHTLN